MSVKKLCLTSVAAIAFSAGCGFFCVNAAESNLPLNVHRVPTSIFSGYGEVDRVIQIRIQEDDVASNDKDIVKIKTKVTMPFDYSDSLTFQWRFSEGVSAVDSKSVSGQLSNFKAGVAQTVEISVKGFNKKVNRQVAFHILGQKNGRRLFNDGIISSAKEKTFEDIVQHVEKIKTQQAEDN